MTPERPAGVTVGPSTYDISYDADELARRDKADRANRYGMADHGQLRIIVEGTNPEDVVRETLCHEILHAVIDVHGLAAHLDDRGSVDETEERIVAGLSPALLDTLRRNPAVAAYLIR